MKELDIYIAIEGPIGVGKTSLAKLIADKLNARKVFEKFEENPFLKDFYDDPESNAFQTQIFFLLQRYQQQQKDIRQLNLSLSAHWLKCGTNLYRYRVWQSQTLAVRVERAGLISRILRTCHTEFMHVMRHAHAY